MTYAIGTRYLSSGKHPRLCTVVDVLTTTNHAGDVVKLRYAATHEFCGQLVTDRDVCAVTIAKGIAALNAKESAHA